MRKISLLILTALCFASCAKTTGPKAPGRVMLDPIITRATEVSFEDGDLVGLTVTKQASGTVYADNSLLTYGSGVFAGELEWYAESNDKAVLTAYYPYSAAGAPASFTVKVDQSANGYNESDLMGARKADVFPTANSVGMIFRHMLTKMVVNVTNESGDDITAVEFGGSIPTAVIDLDAQTAVVDEAAAPASIKAQTVTANTAYRAIVVPQTVAFTVAVKTSAGKTLSQKLASATLVQAGQYTVNIRVMSDDIVVSLSGEIHNWDDKGEIGPDGDSEPKEFEEFADHFVYHGEEYDIVTFSNGTTWMADNLRYVPAGYTPASDPTADSHIWYPYSTDGTTCTPLTDAASVAAKGYFYDYYAALGGVEVTDTNHAAFEGAQGICPPGWHIPSRTDWLGLVGATTKAEGEDSAPSNPDAVFYDAAYSGGKVSKANDAGFNFVFSGTRLQSTFAGTPSYQKTATTTSNCSVETWLNQPSMSYYMSSTSYKPSYNTDVPPVLTNIQFFGLMSSFTSAFKEGKLSLSYVGIKTGQVIRCMKDRP